MSKPKTKLHIPIIIVNILLIITVILTFCGISYDLGGNHPNGYFPLFLAFAVWLGVPLAIGLLITDIGLIITYFSQKKQH